MVTKTDPDTILLHGRDSDRKDGEAAGTITPGDLIEYSGTQTSGAADERQVQRHATEPSTDTEGSAAPRVALEYSKAGRGIDDDYSSGDQVEYKTLAPGEEAFMWLAAGENASIDDPLESNGNGKLKVHDGSDDADTTTTQTYFDGAVAFHAVEAVDNSGGGSAVRIKVEAV